VLIVPVMTFALACMETPVLRGGDGGASDPPTVEPEVLGRVLATAAPFASPGQPPFERDPDAPPVADSVLFGEAITDLELELDDRAEQDLRESPEDDVPAVLRWRGRAWDVGVHLKGQASFRGIDGKPSIVVDTGEFVSGGTFLGRRRFVLQNMIQDGSMLKEHVVYALARAAGVPATRHGHARLRINGRARGLYGVIEATDEAFVEAWFDAHQGNLYQGGYGADLRSGREDNFSLQEPGRDLASPDDLERLVRELDASDDILDVLEACFDVPQTLGTVALELVTGQADGYVRYANNFLLYGAPDGTSRCGARWSLLPWSPDQAFRMDYVLPDGAAGRLVQACIGQRACTERLRERVAEVLGVWEATRVHAMAAEAAARVAPECEDDPYRELACSQERVLTWLEERPAVVREALR
jgi:hypothetical protein